MGDLKPEAEPGGLKMGPLIEEGAAQAVAEKVERAVAQGVTLGLGGKRVDGKAISSNQRYSPG